MRLLPSLASMGFLLTAGCVAGPDYVPPEPAGRADGFLRLEQESAQAPESRWWTSLNNTTLNRLIEQGLADSPSIAVAEARLRQARAGLAGSRAARLPSVNGSAMAVVMDLPDSSLGGTTGNLEFYSLGFDAQWEIDLWGGKRRAVEAALADEGMARAALADARVMLSAEIARMFVLRESQEDARFRLQQRLNYEKQLLRFAQLKLNGGTGTRHAVHGVNGRIALTEAELERVDAEATALTDTLAVLTGQEPGALDKYTRGTVPHPPARVDVGDPAAMLARRPDVMAAERRLAGATARIGVQESRRFPQISLMGLIGIGGDTPGDIVDTSEITTLGLPRLTWSFLDFGRNKSAVEGAEAARDTALAEYRAAVLAALRDAENALARFGAARTAYARMRARAEDLQDIAWLDAARFRAGTISEAEMTESYVASVDAWRAQADAMATLTLSYIALAKSLGLGWQDGEQSGDPPPD